MAQADIKAVCSQCYEDLRERNWVEAEGAYDSLLMKAVDCIEERQARTIEEYRLGTYDRFDWDQDTGTLTFSNDGKPQVVADIVFIGSISSRSRTWLWSWANTSVGESCKARVREVRQAGEDQGLQKLASARWSATEQDGGEMVAISAYLLDAVGFYRAPTDHGFTYMVMTGLRWSRTH